MNEMELLEIIGEANANDVLDAKPEIHSSKKSLLALAISTLAIFLTGCMIAYTFIKR